jgi:predicted RND superfamily exporter protein
MKTMNDNNLPTSLIERLIFNNRLLILLVFVALTLFLGYRATFVRPDTRLEKMIPGTHAYVLNAKDFYANAVEEGNSVIRVAVESKSGTIFDYAYLQVLQQVNDELSLIAGVDTASVRSIWAPSVMWSAITTEGFAAGPVIDYLQFIPENFAVDARFPEQLQANMFKAGIVGSLVSNDFKAAIIEFTVLAKNPKTQQAVNFNLLSDRLEEIRAKYQSDTISLHMIGNAKMLADLVDGFEKILIFFGVALLITAVLLYSYSRCYKATLVPLLCSVVAVIWQIGVLNLLGADLGVFSVLVPFLVFAIGVSHGVQMINSIAHEKAKGESSLDAARITFRHLCKPGLIALLTDGISFAMLLIINIGSIQDLAQAASVGVALVIATNLILLPLIMSYVGVTRSCVEHSQSKIDNPSLLWHGMAKFATPRVALSALLIGLIMGGIGLYFGSDLKVGDLDKGAPELRADSRYNLDNAYITTHFSTSTDQMTLFVKTPPGKAESFKTINLIDQLTWELSRTKGVQSALSPAIDSKMSRYFMGEGNLKMMSIPRDEKVLSRSLAMRADGMVNDIDEVRDRKSLTLQLTDHRQETLQRIVDKVDQFAAEYNDQDFALSLGYDNAAFEAATNQVIQTAQYEILLYVYAVVALLCLTTFRSIRATLCILLPLALTSILANALMAQLGIGVKVATLPVITLGVGIGVDYGIYIYSRLKSFLDQGHSLQLAYEETLKTTGKAVFFTGCTLAVGVATWALSPIKFQADMGVLLTFMFLCSMLGSLTLLPALVYFLGKKQECPGAQNLDGLFQNLKRSEK